MRSETEGGTGGRAAAPAGTLATTNGTFSALPPQLNEVPVVPAAVPLGSVPAAVGVAGPGAGVRSAPAIAVPIRQDLVPQVTSYTVHHQGAPPPSSVVYSTYRGMFGPRDADSGIRLKASTGETFVAGSSNDSGVLSATVTVVSADGSAYTQNEIAFPGATSTVARSIDLDGAGNVYIAGTTNAPGNPVAFVAKLDPTGSTVLWSTMIGSAGTNAGTGVRVNSAGTFVYMTGSYDDSVNGGLPADLLAAKLSTADGTTTGGWSHYYTFSLGATAGSGIALNSLGPRGSLTLTDSVGTHAAAWAIPDDGSSAFTWYYFAIGSMLGVATDPAGNVYTTGYDNDPAFGPNKVLLISKYDPTVSGPIWGWYYTNGAGNFQGIAMAVSGSDTTAIPYAAGLDDDAGPHSPQAVVLKFTADGSHYTDSALLVGSAAEAARGLDLDTASVPDAYLAGITTSPDFPTTPGAAQRTYSGGASDGFVAEIAGLS
jgi:hypothetical protein